jgi:group I intron endonuclease
VIVYKVTNKLNGKCYIGQTIRTLSARWASHCKKNNECVAISRAIQKYGKESFCIDTIAEYKTMEDLNNAEEYYIDWYNSLSPNGYNLHTGGLNHIMSEESKKKLSDSLKGKQTWWLGKPHSKETKKKMSESRIGSNNRMFGRKHSEETKQKIRATALKRLENEEWKKKFLLTSFKKRPAVYSKKASP